jgi:4-diphosphocytidyl-2-C-methyl-D-erythritol kinase
VRQVRQVARVRRVSNAATDLRDLPYAAPLPSPPSIRVRAFAKINLSLRVLGARADGYHELRTILQSIALHDTLLVRRVRGPFRLTCNNPDCPTDATNLISRAALAVWTASGRRGAPRDLAVRLDKQIPMRAGLGGGSSDAAAALRAFARMWRLDAKRLPDLARSLGTDVPYFLVGGTVLGLERGDLLFSLIDDPAWVTLVIPSFGVSTRDAYGWFDNDRLSRATGGGGRGRLGPYGHELQNDLQSPVARRHVEISRMVGALRRAGASHTAMTGSGSAVFGLFDRKLIAVRAAEVLKARGRRVIVTRTIDRGEYRRLAGK